MVIAEAVPSGMAIFNQLRDELAARNKRGLGFFLAGLTYWALMSVAGLALPQGQAAVVLLVGTIIILPSTRLFYWLVGARMEGPLNPLAPLGLFLFGPFLMFWPIFLMVWLEVPIYLPQTLSLLMATPFFVMAYLYRSYTYLGAAAARVAVGSVFMVFPETSYVSVPLLTAAIYAVAAVTVAAEVRRKARGA
jgi:hypothetical protein